MQNRLAAGVLAAALALLVTTAGASSAEPTQLTLINDNGSAANITLYETTNSAPTTVDTMIPAKARLTWRLGGSSKITLLKIRAQVKYAACLMTTNGGDWTIVANGDSCYLKRT